MATTSWRPGPEVGPFEECVRSLVQGLKPGDRRTDLAHQLCPPALARKTAFIVPYFGFRYGGFLNNRIDWHIYFHALHQPLEIAFLRSTRAFFKTLRTPFVCYDVGARGGHLSLAMASMADEVIAFEPFPLACCRIFEKLAVNRMCRVRPFCIGLGTVDEEVVFCVTDEANLQAERAAEGRAASTAATFSVDVRNADRFIDMFRLPPPVFIKVNAANAQFNIFDGLSATIERSKPIILIEGSLTGACSFPNRSALRSLGYHEVDLMALATARALETLQVDASGWSSRWIVCAPTETDLDALTIR